jgi:hypothetical protein
MGMIATVSHCPSINWDQVTGRIFDMTKARARERAKARKGKKRQAPKESPDQQPTLDTLTPATNALQAPMSDANTKNFAAASRGSARSK